MGRKGKNQKTPVIREILEILYKYRDIIIKQYILIKID